MKRRILVTVLALLLALVTTVSRWIAACGGTRNTIRRPVRIARISM